MSDVTITTPSDLEFTTTRSFDAPRELVFAAHTEAEHLRRWWGRGNPLDVTLDFRVGGGYRFVEHAEGQQHGFRGEFREIVPNEKIVHIAVETLTFTADGDKTVVTGTSRFDTRQDRDGMLQSGMEAGMKQSYAALDQLLASLV
jgi:uncharacterized protein YndB with AHSA1/START domain